MIIVVAILLIGLGLIAWGLFKFVQGFLILFGERRAVRRYKRLQKQLSGLDYLYKSGSMSWREYEEKSRRIAYQLTEANKTI